MSLYSVLSYVFLFYLNSCNYLILSYFVLSYVGIFVFTQRLCGESVVLVLCDIIQHLIRYECRWSGQNKKLSRSRGRWGWKLHLRNERETGVEKRWRRRYEKETRREGKGREKKRRKGKWRAMKGNEGKSKVDKRGQQEKTGQKRRGEGRWRECTRVGEENVEPLGLYHKIWFHCSVQSEY